jgi:1-acyl-sn-glycerol-3-phosphate acyltransferase
MQTIPKLPMARLVLHLVVGLWKCALIFPWLDSAGREQRVRRWSQQLIAICGVKLVLRNDSGSEAVSPGLIISNHVSWLDIFVINSVHPCHFVAKSDIRDWPLIGWLCAKTGTIFIARGRQRDVRRIYAGLVRSIHNGDRVAFFPEGTTSAQGTVLPFHANLFEAAIEAQVPVQPYALRYLDADGSLHAAADFIGEMTFAESVAVILRNRRLTAELIRLPAIASEGAHRRELAQAAHNAINNALSPVADTADNPLAASCDPTAA